MSDQHHRLKGHASRKSSRLAQVMVPCNTSSYSQQEGLFRAYAAFFLLAILLACTPYSHGQAQGQCAGIATTPAAAVDCARHTVPLDKEATLDPLRSYSLAELIDIAEINNPQTHILWERARQAAERLGIARSAYFPVLAGIAAAGDSRSIEPFPEPLALRGYVMVEAPVAVPEITLNYLIFDFGKREAEVDAAKAQKIAAGANFIRANQEIAFRVATSYYRLLTAQERLTAAQETLKTAQTTQDAAEAQLNNGRSTLPDVLNAKAETSQAVFDLESADGDEKIARVLLTEAVGAEPSPDIKIDGQEKTPLPQTLTMSIDALIDRAIADRPDLMAQASEIRAADQEVRVAKSEYLPSIGLTANGAQTSLWPTVDSGKVGQASEPTWAVQLGVEWRLFDGGARKNSLAIAQSKGREARDEMREKKDTATREVWTAYIGFRTAIRKQQAAQALLESANSSYSASLDAYKYGVKNLIDVVTAEKQLAQARLSGVAARSELMLQAVDLEFVTGNLLRKQQPATQTLDGQKP
ncbi:TolC family protein [Acidicapsa ligni]|uniref:TolC family protein n=1 Tax=Acidicapsa ligni TaxID=542300 RepID=UPI0021DFEB3F|nr:TolC family protein [Acidicapsa ligni]